MMRPRGLYLRGKCEPGLFVPNELPGQPHMMRTYAPARRPSGRRSLAVAAVGALAMMGALERTEAQRPDQPRISVAATIVAEPASQTLLPIHIGPLAALPSSSFVRLRGLPPSVSLTEGYAIAPGSWAIPLFGLPILKANVPAGISGRGEIIISLVAVDGTVIAEARTALVIVPPTMLPPAEKTFPELAPKRSDVIAAPAGRADRSAQATSLSPQDKARATRLLTQGDKYLVSGNVAAARDFYERAADAGLPEAAIRLATTYDPAELQRFQAQGIVPDRALARKWYERARELGAPEAVERLAKLGGS